MSSKWFSFPQVCPSKLRMLLSHIHAICLAHHTDILCRKNAGFLQSNLAVRLGLLSSRLERVRGLISTKSFKCGYNCPYWHSILHALALECPDKKAGNFFETWVSTTRHGITTQKNLQIRIFISTVAGMSRPSADQLCFSELHLHLFTHKHLVKLAAL